MIRTVADLRRALDAYPDDMRVGIYNEAADAHDWIYLNETRGILAVEGDWTGDDFAADCPDDE